MPSLVGDHTEVPHKGLGGTWLTEQCMLVGPEGVSQMVNEVTAWPTFVLSLGKIIHSSGLLLLGIMTEP